MFNLGGAATFGCERFLPGCVCPGASLGDIETKGLACLQVLHGLISAVRDERLNVVIYAPPLPGNAHSARADAPEEYQVGYLRSSWQKH